MAVGYDLRPFAGQRLAFVRHAMSQKYMGVAADFWTAEFGGKVVGAYVAPEWYGGVVDLKTAAAELKRKP